MMFLGKHKGNIDNLDIIRLARIRSKKLIMNIYKEWAICKLTYILIR